MDTTDCIVVGAGIVGLTCARAIARYGRDVVVVEKESVAGSHTSSRNSEVIHAGIYYPAGSLKARLCVSGRNRLYDYCRQRGIAHQRLGKLIVAGSDAQLDALRGLHARALANGVDDVTLLGRREAQDLEPSVRCVGAMLSPSTGIIDSHEFLTAVAGDLELEGGVVVCGSRVTAIDTTGTGFVVTVDDDYQIGCRLLVNAAGLWASDVATLIHDLGAGSIPETRYAKGHYFSYAGRSPFSHLVYPMPEAGGLGIHATLDLAGTARFGPDVAWTDSIDYGFDESRHARFCQAIADYFPDFEADRLQPAYTGIRPKISGPGEPAADFGVQLPAQHGIGGLANLFGIESPGLTASLAMADMVAGALCS